MLAVITNGSMKEVLISEGMKKEKLPAHFDQEKREKHLRRTEDQQTNSFRTGQPRSFQRICSRPNWKHRIPTALIMAKNKEGRRRPKTSMLSTQEIKKWKVWKSESDAKGRKRTQPPSHLEEIAKTTARKQKHDLGILARKHLIPEASITIKPRERATCPKALPPRAPFREPLTRIYKYDPRGPVEEDFSFYHFCRV